MGDVMRKLSLLVLMSAQIVACGGGGGGGNNNADSVTTSGFFVDANVQGLSYSSPSYSGVTGGTGNFDYKAGEETTFSFKGLTIGAITMSASNPTITPLDLFNTDDVNNQSVINTLVLLQSLDNDKDPSNGVSLPSHDTGTGDDDVLLSGLDISSSSFISDLPSHLSLAFGTVELVPEEDAIAHFEETMAQLNGLPVFTDISWEMRTQENGDVSAQYTFNANGTVDVKEYHDCPDDLWGATIASLEANCTIEEFTQDWALVDGVLTMENDELEDSCYIQFSTAEVITAVCTFEGSGLGSELITFVNQAELEAADGLSSFNPEYTLTHALEVYDGETGECKHFLNFNYSTGYVSIQDNSGSQYICAYSTGLFLPEDYPIAGQEVIDSDGNGTGAFYDVYGYEISNSLFTFNGLNISCNAISFMKYNSNESVLMRCNNGSADYYEIWKSF